jgi:hypothetical protein
VDELRQTPGGRRLPDAERPIFLAPSGRRRAAMRLVARGSALLTAGWLACLVAGSVGFLHFPRMGLPVRGALVARVPPVDRDVADRDDRRCAAARARLATVALAGHDHAAVYRHAVAHRVRACEAERV